MLEAPPGYPSWLEYAIVTMDTRTPYLQSYVEESAEYAAWGRIVEREEMRAAATVELRSLRDASIGAMHTLLHVDADMNERVAAGKRLAACLPGQKWPPYECDDDDDD